METQTTTATERAAALRKQLTELGTQKQTTENKLAEEHAAIRRAALKRGELVESLIGANEASSRRAHKEIDRLDSAIREGERVAEAFQKAITKTAREIEALSNKAVEADRTVLAEVSARALEAFRIKYQQAVRRASESLDTARADLAALTILETNARMAVKGTDENALNRICEPIFAEFALQQVNLDHRGWRLFPGVRNLQFLIRPMTRG